MYLRRPRSLNFRDQFPELPSQSHPATCTEHRLWYRPHREVCKIRFFLVPMSQSTLIWYSMPTSGCISQHVPLPWLQLKEVERPPSNTCWSCDFLLVPPRFCQGLHVASANKSQWSKIKILFSLDSNHFLLSVPLHPDRVHHWCVSGSIAAHCGMQTTSFHSQSPPLEAPQLR